MLHVRIMEGRRQLARIPLDRGVAKIGRDEGSQVRIEGSGTARIQALLRVEGDQARVMDLGCEGGMRVNGELVTAAIVGAGDVIVIDYFELILEDAPDERPPPPTIDPMPRITTPRCPRCGGNLSAAHSTGGPYRGVALNARRCKGCGLTMVEGRDVAGYFDLSGNPNKRALLERKREKLRMSCGSCGGMLEQISLSATDAWVTLEECQQCLQIVLEDSEVESLKALIAEVANIPAG